MSTNIHLEAVAKLYNPSTNEFESVYYPIETWQTPTDVTYDILNSDDPIEAYLTWVVESGKEYDIVDDAERHIAFVKERIEHFRSKGYEIQAYAF